MSLPSLFHHQSYNSTFLLFFYIPCSARIYSARPIANCSKNLKYLWQRVRTTLPMHPYVTPHLSYQFHCINIFFFMCTIGNCFVCFYSSILIYWYDIDHFSHILLHSFLISLYLLDPIFLPPFLLFTKSNLKKSIFSYL